MREKPFVDKLDGCVAKSVGRWLVAGPRPALWRSSLHNSNRNYVGGSEVAHERTQLPRLPLHAIREAEWQTRRTRQVLHCWDKATLDPQLTRPP